MNIDINKDTGTTLLGLVVAGVQAAYIDPTKLMHGDRTEVGKLVMAIATVLWSYFTNKPDTKKEQPK